jgi:hypothetical protein
MGQFMDSNIGKVTFGFLGFGLPLIFLAAQVLFGLGNLPFMILTLSWFGLATLVLAGFSDD